MEFLEASLEGSLIFFIKKMTVGFEIVNKIDYWKNSIIPKK